MIVQYGKAASVGLRFFMFVKMHIPLGKWNADALGIETFLYGLGGIENDAPVIACIHPGTGNKIHAAVCQFRHGHLQWGSFKTRSSLSMLIC